MKKLLLASIAAAAFCTAPALAADMPTKGPVYKAVAPMFSWTGFYVGGNVGYGWGSKDWESGGGAVISPDPNGFLGGAQLGYNWQSGQSVFGIEADWDWGKLKGTAACQNPAFNCTSKINSIASLTGRLGYAWNTSLLYVRAGGAWADDKYVVHTLAGVFNADASETRSGWTVGVGYEFAFAPNWSSRIEYNYYGLGERNITFSQGSVERIKESVQTVTVGLNYRFDWGKAPVSAKY
jgi:outer membrane immunogenic protein